jgi:pimeloyl-ACP methyl ester carboxylesterase
MTFDRRIWASISDRLKHDCTCILPDLPGHGQSSDRFSYDFSTISAALHAVMGTLDCGAPLIVGHSIGAVIALNYATAYPCRGVVGVDQPLEITQFASAMQEALASRTDGAVHSLWKTLLESPWFGLEKLAPSDRKAVDTISNLRPDIFLGYEDVLLCTTPAEVQASVDALLRIVKVPFISTHGNDPGDAYTHWLRERIPQAEIKSLKDGGHFFFLKYPQETAEIVKSLL